MDYSDDSCMREFTEGQFEIMIASYIDFRSPSTSTLVSDNAWDSDVAVQDEGYTTGSALGTVVASNAALVIDSEYSGPVTSVQAVGSSNQSTPVAQNSENVVVYSGDDDLGSSTVATDGESDNGASNAGVSIDVSSTEAVPAVDANTNFSFGSSGSTGSSAPSVSPIAEPSAEPSLDTGASVSETGGSTPLLALEETTSEVDESETYGTTLSALSLGAFSGFGENAGNSLFGLLQYSGSSMLNNAATSSECTMFKSGASCKVDFQCCSRTCVGSTMWSKKCK
jgi:hypothetical protein